MPDVGGSYFTFSNENNDLIWGFLAECNRRGWIYRGHDTMPWCPRCGTGLSQMEMNEGYQDREDPGLTVRFPLIDRPGESLLVWTTTPWTLAANVAAAVGPDLRYVKVQQGDDAVLAQPRHAQAGAPGRLQGRRGARGLGARRLALRGPVRRPARRARRVRGGRLRAPRRRVDRGRRGGGDRHRPHRPRVRRRGLRARHVALASRSSARSTRTGATTRRSAGSPAARRPRSPSRSSTTSSGAGSSTTSRRTATATRTAGGATPRCCSGSSTSGTSAWARSTTSRARR